MNTAEILRRLNRLARAHVIGEYDWVWLENLAVEHKLPPGLDCAEVISALQTHYTVTAATERLAG